MDNNHSSNNTLDNIGTRRHMIVSSESVNRLVERSMILIKGTKALAEQAKNMKAILGSSKGRDKICSMIQYTAKVVYTCNIHSNIQGVQEEMMRFGKMREDKLMSARIYTSMSKNRKIFNLFKSIDEIYYILKINNDLRKEPHLKFFSILSHVGACCYYFLDNFIWMINTRIISILV